MGKVKYCWKRWENFGADRSSGRSEVLTRVERESEVLLEVI